MTCGKYQVSNANHRGLLKRSVGEMSMRQLSRCKERVPGLLGNGETMIIYIHRQNACCII